MKTSIAILTMLLLACPMMLEAKSPRRPGRPTVRGQINKAVNQIEKENKQLAKELKTAQDEYPAAELALKQTYETYKQAKKELRDQEKTLQDRVGTKVGLSDAISAAEKEDDEYKAASEKRTDELEDDEKFQKLLDASDDAEDRLELLREGKSSDSTALFEAAKAALAAKQAIKERLDSDPAVKPLLEAKHEADASLKTARQEYEKASKKDPELRRAEKFQRQSRDAYHEAQQKAAVLEAKIVAIQQQIAINLMLIGP